LRQIRHILRSNTSHTDTAIGDQVNVPFLDQNLTLLFVKASVGEHANLFGDMIPSALGAIFNQSSLEETAHVYDSLRDRFKFILLIKKF